MSNMYKVYITDYIFENFNPEKSSLQDVDCELIPLQCKTAAELIAQAKDADALLNCYLGGIDAQVMDAMPNLKVIVRYGIGFNTIDINAAAERGIQVANVPDYCLDEVSDHAVALALALIRKITLSHNRIKGEQDYGIGYLKPVLPLRGAKLAIFGFGRIGKLIAAKMHPFGCAILFCDPFIPADVQMEGFSARKVSPDEVYAEADIIVLQAPATSENYHLLDAGAFAKMRRKPYIVNCARGELIDEKALADALQTGQIAGAGLDVLESMPPVSPDNPLLKFDNVILTPHSAWVSANSLGELQRLAALEVARALKGGVVKSLLNPDYVKHLK
jgi:D-3-phosphoglycerate dehydrogenase